MKSHAAWYVIVLGFLLSLVAGAVAGSLVQTQFNLLALQNLGVEIGLGTRLETSLQDLRGFAPIYAAVFGVSFLFSQLIASWLIRRLSLDARGLYLALGAAVGLWVTLELVNAFAPMPTLIAATRGAGGLVAMLATAALAGWLFALITRRGSRPSGTVAVVLAAVCGSLLSSEDVQAQPSVDYQVTTIAERLEHPWSIVFLPDGSALVTERPGRLRILDADGELQATPVPGVPEVYASAQAGLFDVAVAPDFEQSRLVFMAYACGTESANHTCLARGRLQQGRLESVEEIFRALPAKKGNAHYGGRIAWLPDGSLILSLGDGFDYREEAQRLGSHIGTLVRLNRDGSVPGNNPFIGQADALPEIYSYGHRNVQGMAFDPVHERLIIHEHGPRGGDEINVIKPGVNYGWPVATHGLDYTGARVTPFTEYDGMAPPALHWTPSIAPSGLTVYQGRLFPQWEGNLLVGALADRSVHRVVLADDGAVDMETLFSELNERIRDVRTGPDGAIYLLTDGPAGRLLRVTPRN